MILTNTRYCCAECGNTDTVDALRWVRVNSNEVLGDTEDADKYYCNECETEVEIVDIDDYKTTDKSEGGVN